MNIPVPHVQILRPDSGCDSRIGCILHKLGKLSSTEIEDVLKIQRELGMRFGEAARQIGLVDDVDIQQALARQFDHPFIVPGQNNYSSDLIVAHQPYGVEAKTIRDLRSQLMLGPLSIGRSSLVIAGIDSNESSKLIAANLAVMFSQVGKRTLLVDANLRNPVQNKVFNLKSKQGLSDILAERASLDTISKIEAFPHLNVLIAGTLPPNPLELLTRESFARLNTRLSSEFDIVLYDVPSYEEATDALAVAAASGSLLLVIRKNMTKLHTISEIQADINRTGTSLVGVVLVDF